MFYVVYVTVKSSCSLSPINSLSTGPACPDTELSTTSDAWYIEFILESFKSLEHSCDLFINQNKPKTNYYYYLILILSIEFQTTPTCSSSQQHASPWSPSALCRSCTHLLNTSQPGRKHFPSAPCSGLVFPPRYHQHRTQPLWRLWLRQRTFLWSLPPDSRTSASQCHRPDSAGSSAGCRLFYFPLGTPSGCLYFESEINFKKANDLIEYIEI